MDTKYRVAHPDMAVELLRPSAKYKAQIINNEGIEEIVFLEWDDLRPPPSSEEVFYIINSFKSIEDSVQPVYTDEQQALLDSVNSWLEG